MLNLALCCLAPAAVMFFQDTIGSDFSDLGRKLLGGFLVGVAFAVAFAVSKVRQRDESAQAIHFNNCFRTRGSDGKSAPRT